MSRLEQLEGVPVSGQRLVVNHRQMKKEYNLAFYDLSKGSDWNEKIFLEEQFPIKITFTDPLSEMEDGENQASVDRMSSGGNWTVTLQATEADSVKRIKAQLESAKGIPVNKQILSVLGRKMQDGDTLETYNLHVGSQLNDEILLSVIAADDPKFPAQVRVNNTGETIKLVAKKRWTVQDVKREIQRSRGIQASTIRMILNGEMLENDKTIEEYGIGPDSSINEQLIVDVRMSQFQIVVSTMPGQNFTMEVEPTDTVLDVKRRIEDLKGVSIYAQKLSVDAKILDNPHIELAEYGLSRGSPLNDKITLEVSESEEFGLFITETESGKRIEMRATEYKLVFFKCGIWKKGGKWEKNMERVGNTGK